MTYTPRTRDRYRVAVAAVTGVTTIGALTATGWLGGVAAADYSKQELQRQAEQAAAAAKQARQQARYEAAVARQQSLAEGPKVILRQRPQKTRVSTQYVQAAGTSSVGPGGSVSYPSTSQPASGTASPSGGQAPPAAPAAGPAPAAPPPPPPPPPAPSTGS